jgi:hypothetical protein
LILSKRDLWRTFPELAYFAYSTGKEGFCLNSNLIAGLNFCALGG